MRFFLKIIQKMKRFRWFISVFFILIALIWGYTNSLLGVAPQSKRWLVELKNELNKKGYDVNLFVISGRRFWLDNWLLNKFGGAAAKSRHLKGEAIDIIILDINGDGRIDSKDVDIVYQILNRKIVKTHGGIGTYKKQKGFFNRQMVHFDCRGNRARWNY